MNQYTYVTATYGEGEIYTSLEEAIEWTTAYMKTEKARCFSPKLWILTKNGDMVGNIYLAGKDPKIMIGEDNPLVIDACFKLRNAIVACHKTVA